MSARGDVATLQLENPHHSEKVEFWEGAKYVEETDSEGNQEQSFDIRKRLGSGAYSTVCQLWQANGEISSFIKVPHTSAFLDLLNEVAVLQQLGETDCLYISKLPHRNRQDQQHFGSLNSATACFSKVNIPCLRLAGIVGLPSSKAVLLVLNPRDILPTIFKKVLSALKHAHSLNWCHLDVRPSNIIVNLGHPVLDFSDDDDAEVMLIDWGCAAQSKNAPKLTGFRGCFPYAHNELLRMKSSEKCMPRDVYDHHSLVYSLVALARKRN
jgi:serine/threonine protein kinase